MIPGERVVRECVIVPLKEGMMNLDVVGVRVESLSNRWIEEYFDRPSVMVSNQGSLY